MDNSATISSQLSIVNCQLGVLKSYFPTLTDAQKQQIDALFDLYSDWNSKINVISRKDIENLYLHHVLHSLGILKMLKFREGSTIMDIGTGGGFPGIPLAILLPEVQFHLVDSHFELEPVGSESLASHLCCEDSLLGVAHATGVRKELDIWPRPAVT